MNYKGQEVTRRAASDLRRDTTMPRAAAPRAGSPATAMANAAWICAARARLTPPPIIAFMAAALVSLASLAPASGTDSTPPAVPPGLRETQLTSRFVQLAWDEPIDAGAGLKEYVILRDGWEIWRTGSRTFADGWLVPSTTYFYAVSAVDQAGNQSAPSAPIAVTPPPIERVQQQLVVRVVLLNFLDSPARPFDLATAKATVFDAPESLAAYMQEVSYGALTLSGSAHGWYTIQKRLTDYNPPPFFVDGQAYGIDPIVLRMDALRTVPASVLAGADATIFVFEGVGTFGVALAPDVLLSARNGFKLPSLAHELGHILGDVWHAGSWNCLPLGTVGANLSNPAASCWVARYGDRDDAVGGSSRHYSSFHKELLGFLSPASSTVAEVDGEYVLDQIELPSTVAQSLRIPLGPPGLFYFLEYRRPVGFDGLSAGSGSAPVDGVLVRLHAGWRYAVDAETLVLPNLVLAPGTPFEDPYRGILVEVLGTTAGSAGRPDQVRLRVTRANRPPRLGRIGDQVAEVGTPLALALEGFDPDGDPLSFAAASLPVGAGFDPAAGSFSWTPAVSQVGQHRLAFRVSDGELSATEVITVAVQERQPDDVEVTLRVNRSADDYKETASGTCGTSDPTHDMWTSNDSKQAFRFRDVPIPRGATIVAARLDLYATGSIYLGRPLHGVALGEAVGNAPAYSGRPFAISSAPKTRASTLIEALAPWNADAHNPLADVTGIVQEIVNREDYAPGNAIKLFLMARSTGAFRRTKTYNSSPERAAKLVVRYAPPR